MVTGVAGTFADDERNKGADSVWKKYPGIKVVARYTGMWDSSTAQRNTAAQLPSLPKVDGIWVQGGTDGVLKAFIDAKRSPLPPTAGEAENGFRKFMLPQGYLGQHVTGISIGQPPFLVLAVARARPRSAAQAAHAKERHRLPFPVVTEKTVKIGRDRLPEPARQLLRRLHRLRPEGHRGDLRPGRAERQAVPGHPERHAAEVGHARGRRPREPAAVPSCAGRRES